MFRVMHLRLMTKQDVRHFLYIARGRAKLTYLVLSGRTLFEIDEES